MLEIRKITKEQIPTEVWDGIHNPTAKFIEYYESKGMFGHEYDYLLIMEQRIQFDECYCYGYVYNGNQPEFSEFGSFGLDKNKVARIW